MIYVNNIDNICIQPLLYIEIKFRDLFSVTKLIFKGNVTHFHVHFKVYVVLGVNYAMLFTIYISIMSKIKKMQPYQLEN